MGTPWWVYLILVIGIITFWSVIRSVIRQLRSQYKIKKHDKFRVTPKGRQQLDVLPEGSTSHSLEQHLLQFFASSEEGRCIGDIPAEISQKEVEEEFRAMIYEALQPKGAMANRMTESVVREMTSSEEDYWETIRRSIASLENKGYVQQLLKWYQLKTWLVEQ